METVQARLRYLTRNKDSLVIATVRSVKLIAAARR
jgi:hypothetical protein